jgi:hypothetical protein
MRAAHQPLLEQARSPKRQHDGDDDHDRVAQEIEDAELALADRHPRVFERGADFRKHADVVEQQCGPDREAERSLRCRGRADAEEVAQRVDRKPDQRESDDQRQGDRKERGHLPVPEYGTGDV